MRVNKLRLKDFASLACRNILQLDFDSARNGHLLAKTVVDVEGNDGTIKKEVAFVVDEGMIKVRATTLEPERIAIPNELSVFEMVPGAPPDLPLDESLDEVRSESIFMLETEARAFEMTLKVLGLCSQNF